MNANYDAKGYYRVLEVSPNAPLSLIKQQYYDRAKFWHPDHNNNPDAVEIFQKISVAYNLLKDQKSVCNTIYCRWFTELKIFRN